MKCMRLCVTKRGRYVLMAIVALPAVLVAASRTRADVVRALMRIIRSLIAPIKGPNKGRRHLLAASVGLLVCAAQTAAAQQLDDRAIRSLRPSEEQTRASETCPTPPHERSDFALDARNVPKNCKAWIDGWNRCSWDEGGWINGARSLRFTCSATFLTEDLALIPDILVDPTFLSLSPSQRVPSLVTLNFRWVQ